jgi:hypothetical protein
MANYGFGVHLIYNGVMLEILRVPKAVKELKELKALKEIRVFKEIKVFKGIVGIKELKAL